MRKRRSLADSAGCKLIDEERFVRFERVAARFDQSVTIANPFQDAADDSGRFIFDQVIDHIAHIHIARIARRQVVREPDPSLHGLHHAITEGAALRNQPYRSLDLCHFRELRHERETEHCVQIDDTYAIRTQDAHARGLCDGGDAILRLNQLRRSYLGESSGINDHAADTHRRSAVHEALDSFHWHDHDHAIGDLGQFIQGRVAFESRDRLVARIDR